MPARTSEKTAPGPIASQPSESLPSYEEIRAERSLKDAFSKLVKDHDEIQRLFISVAAELEATEKIGKDHELCKEWNILRQKHRKLYRDSQLNASQCASFFNNFSTILVPLSRSRMTLPEKHLMIEKFLEAIPAHQESARKVANKFQELSKDVEIFPVKVSSYLRNQAEGSGLLAGIWSGVEELCLSIWNALYGLLTAIVNAFRDMLGCIAKIRFSCVGVVGVEFELRSSASRVSSETHRRRPSLAQAFRDCEDISENLNGFEDAWYCVRLACESLLSSVLMAKNVYSIPAAHDANMKSAASVYTPLVQCLLAYAAGKSPLD
ncbi:hypothetical protein EIP91_002781 [Steccherinum ochraceum]|uniref:Uncharacterized protein n=1 Tax=Steccherinum ochraceum TaxID=92696 RepID=A0A4R0RF41_9APHY|nr:hypothetical protein EIP91_002781 [Steccherinum ochraceum]